MSIPSNKPSISLINDIDSKLTEMEKKLTPAGTLGGRIVRKLEAGWERFTRFLTTGENISRQQASLKDLDKMSESLKDKFGEKVTVYKDASTTEGIEEYQKICEDVEDSFERMMKVCLLVRKKLDTKVSEDEVSKVEGKISGLVKTSQEELYNSESKIKYRKSKGDAMAKVLDPTYQGVVHTLAAALPRAKQKFEAIYKQLEVQMFNVSKNIKEEALGSLKAYIDFFDDEVTKGREPSALIKEGMIDVITIYNLLDKSVDEHLFEID